MAKTGRPPKTDGTVKDVQFSIRLPGSLREQLDASARDNKKSRNEEIESRLHQSFAVDELIEKKFGGPEIYWLLWLMGVGVRSVHTMFRSIGEQQLKLGMFKNRYDFDQVKLMMNTILDHFKPSGRGKIPKHHPAVRSAVMNAGKMAALQVLDDLKAARLRGHGVNDDPTEEYLIALHKAGIFLKGDPQAELEEHSNKIVKDIEQPSKGRRSR
jgi:Arc-like DNA binding domain